MWTSRKFLFGTSADSISKQYAGMIDANRYGNIVRQRTPGFLVLGLKYLVPNKEISDQGQKQVEKAMRFIGETTSLI